MKNYKLLISGYEFIPTCFACPEQYDVVDSAGVQVGYLRLRHGRFTVSCPDYGGDVVFEANPEGDGVFMTHERMGYLYQSVEAIQEWIIDERYKQVNAD